MNLDYSVALFVEGERYSMRNNCTDKEHKYQCGNIYFMSKTLYLMHASKC